MKLSRYNLEKQIQELTESIKTNPNNVEAYYLRGYICHQVEDYYNAMENYGTALQLNPDYVECHYGIGNLYYTVDQPYKAMVEYTMVIDSFIPIQKK